MTFINNDNFSGQTQVPKHNMLLTKRCHKKLIHCAYNQVCQEFCFSSSEEGVYNQRFRYHIICPKFLLLITDLNTPFFQLPKGFIKFRLSMDQGHSNPTGFRLLLCPLSHSCEHGIGGCLRWQEKSNPSQMKTIHHNLSSRECRLRFPLTHKSF